jgi:hypothetical protein
MPDPRSRIQGSKRPRIRIRKTAYLANDKVRSNGHVDAGDVRSCLLVELSRQKKKQTDLAYDKVRGNGHVDAGDIRSCLLVELSRQKKKQTDLAYDKIRGNSHVDAGDVRSCLLVEDGKGRLTRVPRALRPQQLSVSKFILYKHESYAHPGALWAH